MKTAFSLVWSILAVLSCAFAGETPTPPVGPPTTAPAPAAAAAPAGQRVVAWDGDQVAAGSGWGHAEAPATATIQMQMAQVHGGTKALEFRVKGAKWLGAGWNWAAFELNKGVDVSAMTNFTFWIKTAGAKPASELQFNLLSNGTTPPVDQPERHSQRVNVVTYCPQLFDGQWHEVVVPLKDLAFPATFDATKVCEIQLGLWAQDEVDSSFFIDDLAFTAAEKK
jgi:hypothetical protein